MIGNRLNFIFFSCGLLALLPALYLMVSSPLYNGYDVLYHVGRIEQFHQSVIAGQFPPRLAPTLFFGNTYPLFIVNYQLPYYLSEIFMMVNNDPVLAFKAVMALSYLLSGVFAFIFFRTFGSSLASLGGMILWSYLPYRFSLLYFRAAFGENLAMTFIPLIMISLHLILKAKRTGFFLLAISTFGMITAHTPLFLIFSPFFFMYFLILRPNKKSLLVVFWAFMLGLGMTSFQLWPSIFEKNYMKYDAALENVYKSQFVNFFQLFRLPKEGINLGTHVQAGIISTLILMLSLLGLVFKFKKKRVMIFILLFSATAATFFTLERSAWLWKLIPLFQYTIYPWRFISLLIFCVAILGVYLFDWITSGRLKFMVVIFVIFLSIYASRHYFLNSGFQQKNLPNPSLTAYGENDPKWAQAETFGSGQLITTDTTSKISEILNLPYNISFNAQTTKETNIIIRRIYFPGWRIEVNNKPYPINLSQGFIKIKLMSGDWKLRVYFTETIIRRVSNWSTLISLGLFVFLMIKPSLLKIKK